MNYISSMKIKIENKENGTKEACVKVGGSEYWASFTSDFVFTWISWKVPEEIKVKAELLIKEFNKN